MNAGFAALIANTVVLTVGSPLFPDRVSDEVMAAYAPAQAQPMARAGQGV